MGDQMEFPENPIEFLEQYSFKDKHEIYTNGSELIPVFRVKQMIEHYLSVPVKGMTVAEFKKFCCSERIVLRDSYNGVFYENIEEHMNRKVSGFYPRFYSIPNTGKYDSQCGIEVVAWIEYAWLKKKELSENTKKED